MSMVCVLIIRPRRSGIVSVPIISLPIISLPIICLPIISMLIIGILIIGILIIREADFCRDDSAVRISDVGIRDRLAVRISARGI